MKIPKPFLNSKIIITKSKTHGKGMIAIKDIKAGEKILTWGGVWNKDYTNSRGLKKAKNDGMHITQWDLDLYCIEYDGQDPLYHINHSCNPNSWMDGLFTLNARRDIRTNEEITADYALWETGTYKSLWKCKCKEVLCRQTITGDDWKIKNLQKNYKGHFSPLINKLIKNDRHTSK